MIKLSSSGTRQYWEIPVLHEDADLLALDKPAGLATMPEGNEPGRPSLMALLHQAVREHKAWAIERGISHLASVFRLETEASGVLLLARSKAVLARLAEYLGSEKPAREYLALVQGLPKEQRLEINANLAPHPARPGRMRVDPQRGKRARTLVELEETFGKWSLVRCRPLTDRTHQVRVHLRHAGCPVVGDSLYGGKPLLLSQLKPGYRLKPGRQERPLLGTVALHLHKVSLPHPVTGAQVEIAAPLPKDLLVALKYLKKFAVAGSTADTQPSG